MKTATTGTAAPDGIVVIDKPAGLSSAAVVNRVKRLLKAKKAGHTGTLDPFARGVLIVCINRATRLARFLLGDKRYEAVLKLGAETDTQDATGTVLSVRDTGGISAEAVRAAVREFEGPVRQLPPVYSALKHRGTPLYKLARRGTPVQKPARRIHIRSIRILEIALPQVHFEVVCSAGTYIRTLCADIGRVLGCGGHLQALRRTASGAFTIKQAHSLAQLQQAAAAGDLSRVIIPMAAAMPHMPGCVAGRGLVEKIRHGHPLSLEDLDVTRAAGAQKSRRFHLKVIDADSRLVAILEYRPDRPRLDYCCVLPAAAAQTSSKTTAGISGGGAAACP